MNVPILSLRRSWLIGVLMSAALCGANAQESSSSTTPKPKPTKTSPETAKAEKPSPQGAAAEPRTPETLDTIPVVAIEPAPQPASEEKALQPQSPQRLDDVVVTATKRRKTARSLPVSITALKGEDLERIGARDIKDYLAQSPGITLVDSEYGEARGRNLTVRGVGPGSSTGLGNQTVGQFIGDVPMTDPFGNFGAPDLDPFDLKTVEILRGPQGTTFGASALNGAIRYVPNEPELKNFLLRGFVDRVDVKYGGADQTYALATNLPLGDTAALRVSGLLQDAPGLYDNLKTGIVDADSRKKRSARAALRWEPMKRLSVNLVGLTQKSHVDDVLLADNPDGRFENDFKVEPSFIDFDFSLASLDVRNRYDWATLVLQGNWQKKRSRGEVDTNLSLTGGLGISTLRAPFDYITGGNSQEVRLVSNEGGRWDWIFGVFRRDYHATVNAAVEVSGVTALTSVIDPLNAKETAFYGELTRRLGKSWELSAGARRYTTMLDGTQVTRALGMPSSTNPVSQNEKGVSPKVSITYKPSRNFMTYVAVSRGFQFGGVNTTVAPASFENPATGVPIPLSYNSSVLWNRELGVRTDWLDRTLRIDLALYDIRWKDAQLQQQTGGQVSNDPYIDNVGKVGIRGAEGTVSWSTPLTGLSISLNAAYVDARTREEYDPGNGEVIAAGTTLPNVAKVQTASTLAYTTNVGSWRGDVALNYAQIGPAFGNFEHEYEIFDYGTFGLTLGIARQSARFTPAFTLGIANLTDERGVAGRVVPQGSVPGVGPVATWNYIRPRTVNLRLTMDFD